MSNTTEEMKVCSTCKQVKTLDGFYRNRSKPSGPSQCKECTKQGAKKHYENNRERILECNQEYRKANQNRIKEIGRRYYAANREQRNEYSKQYHRANTHKARDRDLRYKYNLSLADFNAISSQQGGVCLVCKEPRPLAVDHDHVTGAVRGLICRPCNSALGLFKESEAALLAAVAYLHRAKLKLQKAV